jgi:hypothetical protein
MLGGEMTPERIAELRALRAMAASGEWKADTHGVVVPDGDAELGTWRVCKTEFIGTANYIEAASNTLPEALAEIEKIRGERDELATQVDELVGAVVHEAEAIMELVEERKRRESVEKRAGVLAAHVVELRAALTDILRGDSWLQADNALAIARKALAKPAPDVDLVKAAKEAAK